MRHRARHALAVRRRRQNAFRRRVCFFFYSETARPVRRRVFFPVRARQHDVQRRAPAQRAPLRRGFARQKPGGRVRKPEGQHVPVVLRGGHLGGDVDAVAKVRLGRDAANDRGNPGGQVDPLAAALALLQPPHGTPDDLAHEKCRGEGQRRVAAQRAGERAVGVVGIGKRIRRGIVRRGIVRRGIVIRVVVVAISLILLLLLLLLSRLCLGSSLVSRSFVGERVGGFRAGHGAPQPVRQRHLHPALGHLRDHPQELHAHAQGLVFERLHEVLLLGRGGDARVAEGHRVVLERASRLATFARLLSVVASIRARASREVAAALAAARERGLVILRLALAHRAAPRKPNAASSRTRRAVCGGRAPRSSREAAAAVGGFGGDRS